MLRMKLTKPVYILIFLAVILISCQKPPGPGGRAMVTGKVFAYDFDNTYHYLLSKGYSAGESVYISYGTNSVVGKDVKTTSDGSFEFLYLNKGHYKIFVNSIDTSIKVKGNNTKIPVIREFDITGIKQTIDLGDIFINK